MVIRRWDRLPATSGTPALLKTIGILVSNTALRPAMEATEKNTKNCSHLSRSVPTSHSWLPQNLTIAQLDPF